MSHWQYSDNRIWLIDLYYGSPNVFLNSQWVHNTPPSGYLKMNCVKPRWKATKYLKRHQKRNIPIKYLKDVWCRSDKKKVDALKYFLYDCLHIFLHVAVLNRVKCLVACQMPCSIKPILLFTDFKWKWKNSTPRKLPDMTIYTLELSNHYIRKESFF